MTELAAPSVVSVYTTRTQTYAPRGLEELFRRYADPDQEYERREPRSREVTGLGSGVIISEDGYIVTNHHVISDDGDGPVEEIRVQLENGEEFIAEVVGSDDKTDVAVIRIELDESLSAATIANSDLLRTGDIVFAIGSPLGQSQTVTQGIVSATERTSLEILGPGSYENFIQTDAAINLGNSGGALIDAWGRLVGINAAIVSGTGGSIGLGYAIPSMMALRVARNLIEFGEVPRGLLGLYPVDLDADLAEAFDFSSTRGALVNQVQEGSAADRAGIRHGDIILKIDDVIVDSAAELRLTVSQIAPGTEVAVTLVRNGETLVRPVVLGSLSGTRAAVDNRSSVLEGVSLLSLSGGVRDQFEIPDSIDGVAVGDVAGDSPYADKLVQGMVLQEVNKEKVTSPSEIEGLLESGSNRLYVWAEGESGYLVLRVED